MQYHKLVEERVCKAHHSRRVIDMKNIQPGIYEHYKGHQYRVLGVAKHSETLEEVVVYEALYGEKGLWVRPSAMFFEEVEVNGKKMPRFRYLGAQS